jgi:hypothetical protein
MSLHSYSPSARISRNEYFSRNPSNIMQSTHLGGFFRSIDNKNKTSGGIQPFESAGEEEASLEIGRNFREKGRNGL